MSIEWVVPTAHEMTVGKMYSGVLYVAHATSTLIPTSYVRDTAADFNLARVRWSPEDMQLPQKERDTIMDCVRLMAEMRADARKGGV